MRLYYRSLIGMILALMLTQGVLLGLLLAWRSDASDPLPRSYVAMCICTGGLVIALGAVVVLGRRYLRPLTSVVAAAHELAISLQEEVNRRQRGVQPSQRSLDLASTLQLVLREAQHDPLTGLCNRVFLVDRLARCIARHQRYGGHFCVAFIDLDGFKSINDTSGHACGDEVLREVGARLQASVRPSDTAARLGGDEFVLLLDETEAAAAENIARQMADVITRPIQTPCGSIEVGMSWGVAQYPEDGMTQASLIEQADARMYEHKSRHRDARAERSAEAAALRPPVGVVQITAYEAARICMHLARRLHLVHDIQRKQSTAYQVARASLLASQWRASVPKYRNSLHSSSRNISGVAHVRR